MAHPRKRDKIYETLHVALQTRYVAGDRLPGERDFARELGLSRRTLRFVLDELEQTGMLERSRRGTFVKQAQLPPGSSDEPISVLLPCPDFMTASGQSAILHSRIIQGARQAAIAAGSRVVTIPVSMVNDPEKIDLRQLTGVHRDSRVMMIGAVWFKKIFPLLRERGCRVGVIANQGPDLPQENHWHICSYRLDEQPGVSARFLYRQGARNILYFGSDAACESAGRAHFRRTLEELNLSWNSACFHVFPSRWNLRSRLDKLAMLWKAHSFDGLILEINPLQEVLSGANFYQATGIPPETPVALLPSLLLNHWRPTRNVWLRQLPLHEAAAEITRFLLGSIPAQHSTLQIAHIPFHEYINQNGGV